MIIIKNITQNQNISYHPALGRQYTVSLSNGDDITLYDEDFLDQYKEYRKISQKLGLKADPKILIGKEINLEIYN